MAETQEIIQSILDEYDLNVDGHDKSYKLGGYTTLYKYSILHKGKNTVSILVTQISSTLPEDVKELADEIKKEREKILSEDAPLHPVARGIAEWLNENGINAPSPHTIYVWLRKSRMQ